MGYGLEVDMIRAGPRARPADHALRLQSRRGAGHDQGRRRHHRRPYGRHHRRRDRRDLGEDARRLRRARSTPSPRRRSAVRERRHRALPRRADRHAGRRRATSSKHCRHCHGFYGASSMERLPVEAALTEQTRKFKAIAFDAGLSRPAAATKRRNGGSDGRKVRDRQGDEAGGARLGQARLAEQSADDRREAAHRHRRHASRPARATTSTSIPTRKR